MDGCKTVLDVLIAARELISVSVRCCKGAYARDAAGQSTHASDDRAVAWCTAGAIRRLSRDNDELYYLARVAVAEAAGVAQHVIARWHDLATHEQIVATFDRAIAGERYN
jgi:hypothetical protein